jgi:hypothetical protein
MMPIMRPTVTMALLAALLPPSSNWPQPVPVEADLRAAGWKEISVPGRRDNRFSADGGDLVIASERAVSFLYAPVPAFDQRAPARLAWQWRVDRDFPSSDLAAKGKDDRPLAVHVWFPAPDARRSGGFMRRLYAGMIGVPEWGRAITYVWGGRDAVGTVIDNPYMDGREGVLIVLRSTGTPTGVWLPEDVDVVADYRKAFAGEPPPPSFVAVSSDTDDTRQSSLARLRDLRFEAGPDLAP